MATKLQLITELAYNTSKELSTVDNWTDFLKTAAWQYKYPFEDQVLIYAQRPDARACADFETWNEKLNRRISRGAKGIALLRESRGRYYLDHVFDVSDTYSQTHNMPVRLWAYTGSHNDAIIETLENTFGELLVSTTLTDSIICAAHNATVDSKSDYISELDYAKPGSLLVELDETNLETRYQKIVETSVAYIVLERMGLSPADLFDDEEFQYISDFNTPETMSVIGNAISEISEQALREISSTISAEIRKTKIFAENKNLQYNEVRDESQTQTERTDEK